MSANPRIKVEEADSTLFVPVEQSEQHHQYFFPFILFHDPRFLCQPLFSEVIAKHICRVLSPNRPFQELNMYKDERYNVPE